VTGVIRIISPTDSVKDRLASYYHFKDRQGLEQAILIAKSNKIDIDNIYISYLNLEKELCDDIIKKSSSKDIPVKIMNSNHKFIIDKNFVITILSPDENFNDNLSENNLSLVLLLEIYENKILFTGDIESDVEKHLVSENKIDIDILKVPHHGSKTSSSDDFISAFNPEYALISVGKNNYNHPSYEALNRYKNKNIKIYRTDEDSLVTIEISDDYFKISSYLSQKQSTMKVIINNYDKIIFYFLYIIIDGKVFLMTNVENVRDGEEEF